ncbi:hypothetical protein [Pseudomonas sp. NPDC096950]|uniref:hypothetical protein n=1 Tax=Pseudomonas sp. NPDC096950 TaxID=3364485 RepID=UPI00383AE1C6
MKSWIVALLLISSAPVVQAAETDWHWNVYGQSSYSGQINLRDDQGSALAYQRYSGAGVPTILGSSSVQPPLMVVAGMDMSIDVVQAGTAIPKPSCLAPKVAKIYVSVAAACDSGVGSSIGGFYAYADETATTFVPRLAVWVQGLGWRAVNNQACGLVKTETLCK